MCNNDKNNNGINIKTSHLQDISKHLKLIILGADNTTGGPKPNEVSFVNQILD